MSDNGFDKACPDGNHMVSFNDGFDEEFTVAVGDQFRDKFGMFWIVTKVFDTYVMMEPDPDTVIRVDLNEIDEYEKL